MNKKKIDTIIDSTGFISIKNLPSEDELNDFYQKHYFQDEKTRPKSYQTMYDEKELKHIDLLNDLFFHSIFLQRPEWIKTKGSLLEAGVGEGFTLARAHSQGWDVKGVDFSDHGLKQFNNKMINYLETGDTLDILQRYISENKKFDICIIKNVLEHTREPRFLLKILKKLLTKNGILSITIPNDFSNLQLKALELGHIKEEFWLEPPQHLHYFNNKNISTFLKSMDLKILDTYSSFPIDFFLFNTNSNYILDEKKGKSAHQARVELEILMGEDNLSNYYEFCRSLVLCNVGRNLTILVSNS